MRTIISDATLLTMEEATPVIHGSIGVEDGRIAAVGEVGPLPEGCRVVEMGGQYLAPGAFNCHTHITISSDADMGLIGGSDARLTLLAIQSLQGFLKAGVTFIRDVGGYSGIDILLRDEIRAGRVQGPDMLACGRCICITGDVYKRQAFSLARTRSKSSMR